MSNCAPETCEQCSARIPVLERLGIRMKGWDFVVTLAGNPNTGKSTVFNQLTGLHQHTGNWPGKTVSRAEGGFSLDEKRYKLVDLPGTYSLLSASPDEKIARDFVLFGQPDVVVIGYVMNDPMPTSGLFRVVAGAMKNAREFGQLAEKSQVLAWVKMNWDKALKALTVLQVYEPFYDEQGKHWATVVDSLKEFKRLSEEDQFHLIVVVFPMLHKFDAYPFLDYHNQILTTLEDLQITHVDLLPEFRHYEHAELRILDSDGTHPNELGHRVTAETLYDRLLELSWVRVPM